MSACVWQMGIDSQHCLYTLPHVGMSTHLKLHTWVFTDTDRINLLTHSIK